MQQDMEKAVKGRIEEGIENEDYHSRESVSSSQLKLAYRNIEMYKLSVVDKAVDYKSSEAFRVGTLFHESVLEPDKYKPVIYPKAKFDKRTKEYKEFVAAIPEKQKDYLLSLKDWDKLSHMKESLESHKECPDFSKTINEASVFYKWQGLDLRTRPDAMDMDEKVIYDIKTTSSPVGKRDFMFHLQKYDYDLSAAMYIHSLSAHTGEPWSFCFVVVQSVEPYTSVMYYVGPNLFFQGFAKYKKAIKRIKWSRHNEIYRFQETSEVLDTYKEVEKFDSAGLYKFRNHLTLGELT